MIHNFALLFITKKLENKKSDVISYYNTKKFRNLLFISGDEDDTALEAKDMELELFDKRLLKLETVIKVFAFSIVYFRLK